jgi:hypothetical protein
MGKEFHHERRRIYTGEAGDPRRYSVDGGMVSGPDGGVSLVIWVSFEMSPNQMIAPQREHMRASVSMSLVLAVQNLVLSG